MSPFDNIIDDLENRFGLGAKAGPLLRELLLLIGASPGGMSGFIDKFRSAGLSHEVSDWLGNPNSAPLPPSQVQKVLGSGTIDMIARKVGLSGAAASQVIGYLAPKMIGQLTPNGVISPNMPASVSDFLHSSMQSGADAIRSGVQSGAQAARSGAHALEQTVSAGALDRGSAGVAPWLLPLLALLALFGFGWHFLASRGPEPSTTASAPTTATQTPATTSSAIASRLAISNDNGVVTVSGTVHDEAARNSIMDMLKSTFGSGAVKGEIAVDPKVPPTPWLPNLRSALDQMKTPGMHAVFSGNSLDLGGNISDADRERLLTSLRAVFKASGLNVGEMDNWAELVADSTTKAFTALTALAPGFQSTDLLNVLNKSIINFPTGSADVPAVSQNLLQQAAAKFKQLPSGTVVQIAGYTDATGDPAANVHLSQQRADAVKKVLVQAGVSPGMLSAKGFGSANPVASNDTLEGRFQNRRIEYQVK